MNIVNNSYILNVLSKQQQNINLKHINAKLILGKYNLLYFNINSLRNKLYDLEVEIFNITRNKNKIIHFIALSETRIGEFEIPYLNIENYNAYHCTRKDGNGGVALFVHHSLSSNLVYSKSELNIELLMVNIINIGIKTLVVYKQPPVNGDAFIEALRARIENVNNMIIVGDTNLNLLNETSTNKNYIDTLTVNGYCVINKIDSKFATRVATRLHGTNLITTKTVIDHIATDCVNFSFTYSQSDSHLSDHKQALLSFDTNKQDNFIFVPQMLTFTKINMENYERDLITTISNFESHNTFDDLILGLNSCKNRNTIRKSFRTKSNPIKPWINDNFVNLLEERNRHFLLRKKSPSNQYLTQKYDQLCDEIKKARYKLRADYNSNAINRNLNNPKNMWKCLNEIIYNKSKNNSTIRAINNDDGSIIINTKQIANKMNEFFCNIGKTLHDNLINNLSLNTQIAIEIERSIDCSMYLWNASEEEVYYKKDH